MNLSRSLSIGALALLGFGGVGCTIHPPPGDQPDDPAVGQGEPDQGDFTQDRRAHRRHHGRRGRMGRNGQGNEGPGWQGGPWQGGRRGRGGPPPGADGPQGPQGPQGPDVGQD
jgi:hypothetical protein